MAVVRQFVLRLEEAEDSKMEALKKITCLNTDTGAIKHLIRNFEGLNNRYLEEMRKKNEIEAKYQELKKQIAMMFFASDEIKRILEDGKKATQHMD